MNQPKICAFLSILIFGIMATPLLAQIGRVRPPIVRPVVKPKPPPVPNHHINEQVNRSVYLPPNYDHDERSGEEREGDEEGSPNSTRTILIVLLAVTICAMIYAAIAVPNKPS